MPMQKFIIVAVLALMIVGVGETASADVVRNTSSIERTRSHDRGQEAPTQPEGNQEENDEGEIIIIEEDDVTVSVSAGTNGDPSSATVIVTINNETVVTNVELEDNSGEDAGEEEDDEDEPEPEDEEDDGGRGDRGDRGDRSDGR